MPNEALAQFANQQYLNLESFKRDGTPVQTPLWFAEEEGVFYIYTLANAWKAKLYTPESTSTDCAVYDAWQRHWTVG